MAEIIRNKVQISSDGTPRGTSIIIDTGKGKIDVSNLVLSVLVSINPKKVVAQIKFKDASLYASDIRALIFEEDLDFVDEGEEDE